MRKMYGKIQRTRPQKEKNKFLYKYEQIQKLKTSIEMKKCINLKKSSIIHF